MKFFNKTYIKLLIVIFVFSFTFILRAHNYDRAPSIGHLEELAFAWAGINLIYDKVPMSWSTLDYPKSSVMYKGETNLDGNEPKVHVTLYSPWLDQPPLYSLISGGTAYLFGDVRWDVLPSSHIRLPQIFISFFISVMIFLLARLVSGYWTGIIALLIYGTSPMFILSSRMAVPENLIALIFLIIIYQLLTQRVKKSLLTVILISILIGIAGLSKATGFLIAPLVIFELFKDRRYKSIVYTIGIVGIFVGLFFLYGLHYNPEIFWRIMEIQSSRPVGFGSLGYFLNTPAFDINLFFDNFYIFCVLSLVYYVFSYKRDSGDDKVANRNFLVFAGVYWLIVVMMSGGERDLLAWYRFGFFPLLPIFGAWGLKDSILNFSFARSFFAICLFLGNRILLVNPFRPNLEPGLFRTFFSVLMFPSLAFEIFQKKYLKILGQAIIVLSFVVGVYINIVYVYNIHELSCESIECPIGPPTAVSKLYFPVLWRFFVLGDSAIR